MSSGVNDFGAPAFIGMSAQVASANTTPTSMKMTVAPN